MKPQCIVLDEPTAMLDPMGRREVINAITKLNKEEGITIILITHYMEETINSDRIYVMDKGNIVMQGKPDEIFEKVDELREHNLHVPEATYMAYLLKKRGIDIRGTVLNADDLVDEVIRNI